MLHKYGQRLAWAFFLSIIILELLIDFGIRSSSVDFYNSGISQSIWFYPQVVAFIVGGYILSFNIQNIVGLKRKIVRISLHAAFSFVIYLVILYSYVLGVGIDSF